MKTFIMTLLLGAPLAIAVGCSGGGSKGNNSQSSSDLVELPQKPKVFCQIQDSSSGTVIRTISGSASRDAATAPAVTGSMVKINCAKSESDSGDTSVLSFKLTDANGAPVTGFSGSVSSSWKLGTPGRYSMVLTASDTSNGTSTTLPFYSYVQCDPNNNNLALTSGGVSVGGAGKPNYFNYSVASGAAHWVGSAPAGANGLYQYAFDFNGDGIVDIIDPAKDNVWSDPTAGALSIPNIYNAYVNKNNTGSRTVRVLAMDNSCFYTAEADVTINFDQSAYYLTGPVSMVPPITTPYYYIQTDLRPKAGQATTPNNNVDLMYTSLFNGDPQSAGKGDKQHHVICNPGGKNTIGKIAFSVQGANTYTSDATDAQAFALHFNNVVYPAGQGAGPLLSYSNLGGTEPASSGEVLDSMTYTSDEGSEGIFQVPYNKIASTSCKYKIQVQRLTGQTPCSDTDATIMDVMRYYGSFTCDDLNAAPGKDVVAQPNGFFFCEAAIGDACVGGGQGGGGIPFQPR